jgi:hypothetical protein
MQYGILPFNGGDEKAILIIPEAFRKRHPTIDSCFRLVIECRGGRSNGYGVFLAGNHEAC